MGSMPTRSASTWMPFRVRTTTRSAPITTLAVVRIMSSSTATPEPTRVWSLRFGSASRTPRTDIVFWAKTVTTEARALVVTWSTSVCSAERAFCARAGRENASSATERSAARRTRWVIGASSERDDRLVAASRRRFRHRRTPALKADRIEDELDVLGVVEERIGRDAGSRRAGLGRLGPTDRRRPLGRAGRGRDRAEPHRLAIGDDARCALVALVAHAEPGQGERAGDHEERDGRGHRDPAAAGRGHLVGGGGHAPGAGEHALEQLGSGLDARQRAHELQGPRERLVLLPAGRARAEMRFDPLALGLCRLVVPIRPEQPDHLRALHGSPSRLSKGINLRFSIARARLMRERTVPPGMPSTCAISSYASPSMSRSTSASRYFSGTVAIACPIACCSCSRSIRLSRPSVGSASWMALSFRTS